MTTYYFIRHGESTANLASIASGWSDVPLTELGRTQAEAAGQSVLESGLAFDCIVSSPLQRAHETAKIVASVLQYDESSILLLDNLKERSLGKLELKPIQDIFDTPEENFAKQGGESIEMFQTRVRAAIAEIHERTGHCRNVLVVAHAGVYKIGMTIARNEEMIDIYKITTVKNATLTEFPI